MAGTSTSGEEPMSLPPYYFTSSFRQPFSKLYGDNQEDSAQKVVMELRWKESRQWVSKPESRFLWRYTRREVISSGSHAITEELQSFLARRRVRTAVRRLLSAMPLAHLLWPSWEKSLQRRFSRHIFDLLTAEIEVGDDTEFAEIKFVVDIELIKDFLEPPAAAAEPHPSDKQAEAEADTGDERSDSASKEEEEEDCAICLQVLDVSRKPIRKLPCSHRFHKRCITNWLQEADSCPICRRSTWQSPPFLISIEQL